MNHMILGLGFLVMDMAFPLHTPHPRSKAQEEREKMPPPKRPKTVYNARTKSVHTLKKKIRDGQRLLTRTALSADVAAETERALAAWQLELAAAQAARRERKLAQDYRMVRFFGSPTSPRLALSLPFLHLGG